MCALAGFSDRLLGIIGVFYYALLTGRAFQVHVPALCRSTRHVMQPSCACVTLAHSLSLLQISEGEHAHSLRLENAYAQPNINWTATQDYGKYIRHSKGGEETISQTYKYIDALHVAVGDGLVEFLPWLKAHSAQELEMEEQHVIVLLNRGSTQQLFRNHYLEARLSEMGLREDTAFGCAMEFLFRRAPCYSGGSWPPRRQ